MPKQAVPTSACSPRPKRSWALVSPHASSTRCTPPITNGIRAQALFPTRCSHHHHLHCHRHRHRCADSTNWCPHPRAAWTSACRTADTFPWCPFPTTAATIRSMPQYRGGKQIERAAEAREPDQRVVVSIIVTCGCVSVTIVVGAVSIMASLRHLGRYYYHYYYLVLLHL